MFILLLVCKFNNFDVSITPTELFHFAFQRVLLIMIKSSSMFIQTE